MKTSLVATVSFLLILGCLLPIAGTVSAGEVTQSVSGELTINGEKVPLGHVYVYAQKEGFYNEDDPTWTVLFVDREIAEREVDDHIWDAAHIRIGITRTAEFSDAPELQVLSQDIQFSADGASVSGGSYPNLDIKNIDEHGIEGRIFQPEMRKSFDNTYQYDFTFRAPMSDPFGPIGDPLPDGGGKPGTEYIAWCEAVHAGDFDTLKGFMPPEQAEMLESDEFKQQFAEELEFMQAMTPTKIKITGGSSDGTTAILNVDGMMEGESVKGQITMTKHGEHWLATESAWE